MTCSKSAKWLMTCSKLAVLNKAIYRLKRHRFLFTWEKQWQTEWSMALFKSQKSKKKMYIEITDPYSFVT